MNYTILIGSLFLAGAVFASSYAGTYVMIKDNNSSYENQNPVIGIFTQPNSQHHDTGLDYIPATYIKYLEAGGAQIVEIDWRSSDDEIRARLDRVNGVLYPGGPMDLEVDGKFDTFTLKAQVIWDYAKELNDRGDYFPVWGTCQGHEIITTLVAGTSKILDDSETWFKPSEMKLIVDQGKSRIFKSSSPDVVKAWETIPSTYNVHHLGTTESKWSEYPQDGEFFTEIATSLDDDGKVVIAIVESKEYPFYGVQFHPEKNLFDYSKENMPHEEVPRQLTEDLLFFFVEEARKNDHKYGTYAEISKDRIQNVHHALNPDTFWETYSWNKTVSNMSI